MSQVQASTRSVAASPPTAGTGQASSAATATLSTTPPSLPGLVGFDDRIQAALAALQLIFAGKLPIGESEPARLLQPLFQNGNDIPHLARSSSSEPRPVTADAPVSRSTGWQAASSAQASSAAHRASFEAEMRGRTAKAIDVELAEMAQDAYDPESRGIEGWTRLDERQLAAVGIRADLLENAKTGFRAAVYTDGQGRYVLAFAGTHGLNVRDWIANFGQGLGFEAEQYAQARDLALLAHGAFGGNLVVTGHSLGGGLASYAALATDSAAVTFNAVGLHSDTIRSLGLTADEGRAAAADGLVRNYRVDGEGLTYAQEEDWRTATLMPDAVGYQIDLADPHSFWEHLNPLNLWEPSHRVRLHLMDVVLDALRQERPWEREADAA